MTETVSKAWDVLHDRKRTAWLTAGICVPTGGLALYLESPATLWIYIACAVAIAVAIERVTSCPCPRCSKRLFRQGLFHNTFSKSCLHCGLEIDSDFSDDTR